MVFPLIAAAIGGVASLAGGFMQANAAQQAAKTQAASADKAIQFQKEAYEQTRADNLPFLNAGKQALYAYGQELGIEFAPGTFGDDFQAANYKGFQETPGYQFAVEQGEQGVTNNLAALGMRNSGNALKALTDFRMGLANQEYGNYLQRLSGLTGMGQAQTNNQNALTMNNAANVAQLTQDKGAATASGYVGQANAWSNALSGLSNQFGNAFGQYSMSPQANALNFTPATPRNFF